MAEKVKEKTKEQKPNMTFTGKGKDGIRRVKNLKKYFALHQNLLLMGGRRYY